MLYIVIIHVEILWKKIKVVSDLWVLQAYEICRVQLESFFWLNMLAGDWAFWNIFLAEPFWFLSSTISFSVRIKIWRLAQAHVSYLLSSERQKKNESWKLIAHTFVYYKESVLFGQKWHCDCIGLPAGLDIKLNFIRLKHYWHPCCTPLLTCHSELPTKYVLHFPFCDRDPKITLAVAFFFHAFAVQSWEELLWSKSIELNGLTLE